MMAAAAKETRVRVRNVQCDHCGKRVFPGILGEHRKSDECMVLATAREMRALGFERTGTGPTLKALTRDVPEIDEMWCYAPTGFTSDSPGYMEKRPSVVQQCWAVPWLATAARILAQYEVKRGQRVSVVRRFLADARLSQLFSEMLQRATSGWDTAVWGEACVRYWLNTKLVQPHDELKQLMGDEELHAALVSAAQQGSNVQQLNSMIDARVRAGGSR